MYSAWYKCKTIPYYYYQGTGYIGHNRNDIIIIIIDCILYIDNYYNNMILLSPTVNDRATTWRAICAVSTGLLTYYSCCSRVVGTSLKHNTTVNFTRTDIYYNQAHFCVRTIYRSNTNTMFMWLVNWTQLLAYFSYYFAM